MKINAVNATATLSIKSESYNEILFESVFENFHSIFTEQSRVFMKNKLEKTSELKKFLRENIDFSIEKINIGAINKIRFKSSFIEENENKLLVWTDFLIEIFKLCKKDWLLKNISIDLSFDYVHRKQYIL